MTKPMPAWTGEHEPESWFEIVKYWIRELIWRRGFWKKTR